FHFTGSITFENSGAFDYTGTGTLRFQDSTRLNNSGSVNVQTGTLDVGGAGDISTGSFTVAATATLQFEGGRHDLTDASSVTGNGTVAFHGGITNLAGVYDLGTGPTRVDSAFATVNVTHPVTSVGRLLFVGGTIDFSGGAPFGVDTLNMSTFGRLRGSDDLTVNSQLNWDSGVMAGTGSTVVAD